SGKGDPHPLPSFIATLAIMKSNAEVCIEAEHPAYEQGIVAGIDGFGSNIAWAFAPWMARTCVTATPSTSCENTTVILSEIKGDVALAKYSHSLALGVYEMRGVKVRPLLSMMDDTVVGSSRTDTLSSTTRIMTSRP